MPKHYNNVQVHFFITQALTSNNVNLSSYRDEAFKNAVKLVAIQSIIAILERIKSMQIEAKLNKQEFSLSQIINLPNPLTRLNMLDYCLVAGFDEIAIHLMHLGATTTNIDSLQQNITNTFGNNINQSDVMREINSIIQICVEIKQNYDQIVTRTNQLVPKISALGKKIVDGYNTPTLVLLGIGCLLLVPVLHPLAHGVGGVAAMVSAGLLPGVISGLSSSKDKLEARINSTNSFDEQDSLKALIRCAKSIKSSLEEAHKPRLKHRRDSSVTDLSQVSLLHHLDANKHNAKSKKKDKENHYLRPGGM